MVPPHMSVINRPALSSNVRRSPYFDRTDAEGASDFLVYNHMYMPMAYGRDPIEDYRALTERVTLWDVGAERQTEIRGPDALKFADFLTTRSLADMEPYRCRYTFCCDETGQIMCDPVLLMLEDRIWLSHGTVDLTLWAKGLSLFSDQWDVEVSEPDVAPLQVQGPDSPEVMRALLGDAIDDLKPFRCTAARIAGVDVIVSRTGWSGGAGYEIFPIGSERALELWDAVVDAGRAHDMLVTGPNIRKAVESGITDTSLATNQSLNPLEIWQDYGVDFDAGPFIGREALLAIRDAGPTRKQVGLIGSDQPTPRQEGFWDVRAGGESVGSTRWAVHSFALERNIAIGIVDIAYAELGTQLGVVHPDGIEAMEVTTIPFVR
jgi:glycine cleavage system aminomethyltransferase T